MLNDALYIELPETHDVTKSPFVGQKSARFFINSGGLNAKLLNMRGR